MVPPIILGAVGLWILVFAASVLVTSIAVRRGWVSAESVWAGVLMQASLLAFSIMAAALLVGDMTILGAISCPARSLAEALAVSAIAAAAIHITKSRMTPEYIPPFVPRKAWEYTLLLLIMASIGEETLPAASSKATC